MKKITKIALTVGATIMASSLITAPAQAADLPCKTAKLIVPWKAGGGTHVLFTIFEKTIQELDVTPKIKVVTMGGQGGNKGAKEAAKSKPDGCTLFAIHQSAITSYLNKRIDFHYDGFGKADMWHNDHTNHQRPPNITALYAVELPNSGGATWFANMYAGLDALSDEQCDKIDGLHTINDMENSPGYSASDRQRTPGKARHPMVSTHPETGRQALYFHVTKSQQIEGMVDAEV